MQNLDFTDQIEFVEPKEEEPVHDTKKYFFYETMLGKIGIAERSGAVTDIFFASQTPPPVGTEEETFIIKEAYRQLDEYLHKRRKDFKLPVFMEGTEFQMKVWREITKIPYGKTKTYAEIAEAVGSRMAARAVGQTANKNPIAIVIPCHRVIGESGKLIGYAAGLNFKSMLLDIEGCKYKEGWH
ncbi:MAG: methylated-DNA--[protein]-cysteine S-methyltransferase [Clostridia bacterium]|nr:methylated-DNA--[protein]-cysteine S-methyltransferase [Clostridia bacterium]